MKGQLNARMPGLRATRRLGTGGGSAQPPAGFIYLRDSDGSILRDSDGAYLMERV